MTNELNKYFDNAATSFPKPVEVYRGVENYISQIGGTYGRSAYGKVEQTTTLVEDCRDMMLEQMGAKNGYICWALNATDAFNMLLSGIKHTITRAIISPMEHNAIVRVLTGLSIPYDLMPHHEDGVVDLDKLKKQDLGKYSIAIVIHQSNINGTIQPIDKIKQIIGNMPLVVDTAQSLGEREFLAKKWNIDYAIFTAHKGLYSISGVGGFYAKEIKDITITRFGGTGSRSDSDLMPEFYPDKFQCGTPNTVGIVGLYYALKNKPQAKHTFDDFISLIDNIRKLKGIKLFVSTKYNEREKQGEVFSITYDRITVSQISATLWQKYQISTRSGLHCSPLAHKTIGSFENGSVRFSLSAYHTKEDLDYLYQSIKKTCK